MKYVIKRNGSKSKFNIQHIIDAIKLAQKSYYGETNQQLATQYSKEIYSALFDKVTTSSLSIDDILKRNSNTIDIETIQDAVETVLQNRDSKLKEEYSSYRRLRKIQREKGFGVNEFDPEFGAAVAERTYLRQIVTPSGSIGHESLNQMAIRVAAGNCLLNTDFEKIHGYLMQGSFLPGGRHLANGDIDQPSRNMEIYTNCSSAHTTFMQVYLLLNGSGVGRDYSSNLMTVDWSLAPELMCILDSKHPNYDYANNYVKSVDYGMKIAELSGKQYTVHKVADSREGWAYAIGLWEYAAFNATENGKKDESLLILDFSDVRAKGKPIGGMQSRPASGPIPLIVALMECNLIKNIIPKRWMQAMIIDHYLAVCVLHGGVRRSAKLNVMYWNDPDIKEFVTFKRNNNYFNKFGDILSKYIDEYGVSESVFTSANHSVLSDSLFWDYVINSDKQNYIHEATKAIEVFELATTCQYYDRNGEPAFINYDKLANYNEPITDTIYSGKLDSSPFTNYVMSATNAFRNHVTSVICNPCTEIALKATEGFCNIGSVSPFYCSSIQQAHDVFKLMTRFLIRVNLLPSVYENEVKRTNRIGVGLTAVLEFAYKFFNYTFYDLLDEDTSQDFWDTLKDFNRTVNLEAIRYSRELGLNEPHTTTTIKPDGTVSKLRVLTEGCHLPKAYRYLRNTQFNSSDPVLGIYKKAGYTVRDLKSYSNTSIVSFPVTMALSELNIPENKQVISKDVHIRDHFKWISLLEKYWISGDYPEKGNQISYTASVDCDKVSFEEYQSTIKEWMPKVKVCSIFPETADSLSSFEYLPNEYISKDNYDKYIDHISTTTVLSGINISQAISEHELVCASGVCPI